MSTPITKLKRNDVQGAIAFLRAALDEGRFTSDDGQTLAMLQDDPAKLEDAVAEEIGRRRRDGAPIGPFADQA